MTIGRFEIWDNSDEWLLGRKNWLPHDYSALAHYQIRWLKWGFTLWKKHNSDRKTIFGEG